MDEQTQKIARSYKLISYTCNMCRAELDAKKPPIKKDGRGGKSFEEL